MLFSLVQISPPLCLPPGATQTVAMTVGRRKARTLLLSASSQWAWARSCFLKDMVTVRARGRATAREECTPTTAATATCLTLTLLLCHPDWECVWTVTKDASPTTMPTRCAFCGRDTWIVQFRCVRPSASLVGGLCSCRTLWPIGALRSCHHGG